jgi:hypothetical protein
MNEEFEPLKARIAAADPGRDASIISESTVAAAALGKGVKAPWSKRLRQLTLSGSLLGIAGAFALAISLAVPQQPLIQMASSQGANAMSAEASVAGDAAPGMKMIMPTWIQYEYDSSELSDATGNGKVYQLVLEGDYKEFLQSLADYFGVEGELREEEWSTKEYPTFAIGVPEKQVGLTWAGTGTFYYNSYDQNSYRCEKRTVEQENGESYETCDPISTPELIPTESQIRTKAAEIFKRFGLSIPSSKIRVDRSEWGASAVGAVQLDGQDTALEWWINYDGAGKLSNIYGHLAKPVARGDFKTVSAKDAADRIKDGRWFGSPPSSVWNQMPAATSARVGAIEPAVDPMPVAPEAGTTDENGEGTTSENVEPKVEIIKLKLTSSEPQLLMIYDKSGGAWLVPGYLLKNDQGWFDAIISLEEGVIELPEPMEVGIMPIEENPNTKDG